MQRCFDAGLRHVNHFWSAMSSVKSLRQRFNILEHPMQGSIGRAAAPDAARGMSTEVLADGCHLAPELLAFAFRMKGPGHLCLVTDSSRALGMPPGHYRLGPARHRRTVHQQRAGRLPGRPELAGKHRRRHGRDGAEHEGNVWCRGLCDTVRMASLTPAERAGMHADIGSLACGKWADVVVLDDDLNVRQVFIGGSEFARGSSTPSLQEIGD